MSQYLPHVRLTDKYAQAVAYASMLHATDIRKGASDESGIGISYLSHLLGVSSLVIEAGGTEDEAIAGLLHDAVEDAGGLPRLADIRDRFGDRVADIVLACSDSTNEAWKDGVPYWERKQKYLGHLECSSDPRAVLVSIADKTHNARAIVTDLERTGYSVLKKFNGTPEEVLRYYSECLRIGVARGVPDTLTIPLSLAVRRMRNFHEAAS